MFNFVRVKYYLNISDKGIIMSSNIFKKMVEVAGGILNCDGSKYQHLNTIVMSWL